MVIYRGHLDDHRILATPTAIGKGMMQVRDMVVVDQTGAKLKGKRDVSSEIGMHLTIYKNSVQMLEQWYTHILVPRRHLHVRELHWTSLCAQNS